MKALALLALAGVSCVALADGNPAFANGQGQQKVEQYDYSMNLDVARVIKRSEVPDVCAVVPVQMTYEDHQGQQHTVEYQVMGNGCSNG